MRRGGSDIARAHDRDLGTSHGSVSLGDETERTEYEPPGRKVKRG
jgi:hypothetical protein